MCRALAWLGGDVAGYAPTRYLPPQGLDGEEVESWLSAAALNEWLHPDKRLVIVPSTLFEVDHCRLYRRLLEAKAGLGGLRLVARTPRGDTEATSPSPAVEELLKQGFGCAVVPHPGEAKARRLEEHGETVIASWGGRVKSSVGFNAVLNTVYKALSGLAREGCTELHIDLTHGTNVLVSAALLAAALVESIHGVAVRAYMAPIMGPPGEETRFIEVTAAVAAVNQVAAGVKAWSMLDERLLPIEAFTATGRVLGQRYGRLYGGVKSVLEAGRELLWTLRSGQPATAPPLLERLSQRLAEARQGLEAIRGDEEALRLDAPWLPIAEAVVHSSQQLVDTLSGETTRETIERAMRLLVEKGMPDRALGTAREWLIALLLARLMGSGSYPVGGLWWASVEEALQGLARSKEDLGAADEVVKAFDRARKLRNRLMHGRLSREENVLVRVEEGDVYPALPGGDLRPIDAGEIAEEVSRLLEVLGDEKALRGLVERLKAARRESSGGTRG